MLRWVRALTLALVMLGCGVAGHVAAGGSAPAASLLVPVFVLLAVAVAPLLGAPPSMGRAAALLIAGQAALHVVLEVLGGSGTVDVVDRSMSMQGHGPAEPLASHLLRHDMTPASAGSLAAVAPGGHLGMLLVHAAAALVVGLWLAAGERAAWTVVAVAALPVVDAWIRLRELARTDAVGWAAPRPLALPRWSHEVEVRSSTWAGRGVSRRGPPRLRAA